MPEVLSGNSFKKRNTEILHADDMNMIPLFLLSKSIQFPAPYARATQNQVTL